MNYDLANQYMALRILDMRLSYAFLSFVSVVFIIYCIYGAVESYLFEREWERKKKESLEHLKQVQDRFKDDDLR